MHDGDGLDEVELDGVAVELGVELAVGVADAVDDGEGEGDAVDDGNGVAVTDGLGDGDPVGAAAVVAAEAVDSRGVETSTGPPAALSSPWAVYQAYQARTTAAYSVDWL